MKGVVQWSSVNGREDFASSQDRTRSARSVGQGLTHLATGAPQLLKERICSIKSKFIPSRVDLLKKNMSLRAPDRKSKKLFPFVTRTAHAGANARL